MPSIGPKGSGVGVGVDASVGCVVGVSQIVGALTTLVAVGVTFAVVAVR